MLQCVEILRGFFSVFSLCSTALGEWWRVTSPMLLCSLLLYVIFTFREQHRGERELWDGVDREKAEVVRFFLTYSSKNTRRRRRKVNENWRRSFEFWEASRGCWKLFGAVVVVLRGKSGFRGVICTHWEWISIENKLLLSGTWEILRYFYFSSSDPWSAHRITQEISEILLRVRALFGWPMTCEFFLVNCLFGHSTANFIQVFQSSQQNAKKIVEIIYALDTRVCV